MVPIMNSNKLIVMSITQYTIIIYTVHCSFLAGNLYHATVLSVRPGSCRSSSGYSLVKSRLYSCSKEREPKKIKLNPHIDMVVKLNQTRAALMGDEHSAPLCHPCFPRLPYWISTMSMRSRKAVAIFQQLLTHIYMYI